LVKGKKASLDEAIEFLINNFENIGEKYGWDSIAVVSSPYLTNEENYLIYKLFAKELGTKIGILPSRIEGDDIIFGDQLTINSEKAPNEKGARAALGLKSKKGEEFRKIIEQIEEGTIKALLIFNGDPDLSLPNATVTSSKKLEFFAICESLPSGLGKIADIVFAGNLPPEKDGTYTNHKSQTRRLHQAVFKPMNSEPEWKILLKIAERWRKDLKYANPREIFEDMKNHIDIFKNVNHQK
jgi:predicted molibdopterin-dependent oxidoreductase YjgC